VKVVLSLSLALLVAVVLAAGVRAAEAERPGPPFGYEDPASRTSVTFPGGYWRTLSRAQQGEMSGGGCSAGVEAPAAFAWAGQHLDLSGATVQCWRVPRTFQVRTPDELEALKTGLLQVQMGDGLSVEIESHDETVRDDMMVHRARISIQDGDKSFTRVMAHFFLRQADGAKSALWYQLWFAPPDDADLDISAEFDAIVKSFRYTGATLPIAKFYEPNANEDQTLAPAQAGKSFTPPRKIPWLAILAMIGVVVYFMRPRRKTEAVAR
jgi:hypothetical protein